MMVSLDVEISRGLMVDIHQTLRSAFPGLAPMKQAWVYNTDGDYWEGCVKGFGEFPEYRWYGKADNAYEARHKTWFEWNKKFDAVDLAGSDDPEFQ